MAGLVRGGLQNVIVKKSTEYGAPRGTPTNPIVAKLMIDPGIAENNGGFSIDVTRLPNDVIKAAFAATAHLASTREQQRPIISHILRSISEQQGSSTVTHDHQNPPPNMTNAERLGISVGAPDRPGYVCGPHAKEGKVAGERREVQVEEIVSANRPPVVEVSPPAAVPASAPLSTRSHSPMMFEEPPKKAAAAPAQSLPLLPKAPVDMSPNAKVESPKLKVTFKVEGVPFETDGFFHGIEKADFSLALIFDNRCVDFPRVFPSATELPTQVFIHATQTSYRVKVPGIRFTVQQTFDTVVLLVLDEL